MLRRTIAARLIRALFATIASVFTVALSASVPAAAQTMSPLHASGFSASVPANTVAPSIAGVPSMVTADNTFNCGTSCVAKTPKVTGSVTASPGTWNGSPTFSYQWQDCDMAGANCTNATGAGSTSATYTLNANDLGHTLKVVVTATNASGSASAAAYTGPGDAQFGHLRGPSTLGPLPALTLAQYAERYQSMNFSHSASQSAINTMLAANPNVLLAPYLHASWSYNINGQLDTNSCVSDATTISQATSHPGDPSLDWFVRTGSALNAAGSKPTNIYDKSGSSNQPAHSYDVGNAAFQQSCFSDLLNTYKGTGAGWQKSTDKGWNSIYLDVVSGPLNQWTSGDGYVANGAGHPEIDKYSRTGTGATNWTAANNNFFANLKAFFGANGGPKVVIPNIGSVNRVATASASNADTFFQDVVNSSGAANSQDWMASANPPVKLSGARDLGTLSQALYAEAHNAYYLADTQLASSIKEPVAAFAEATLLLAANGRAEMGTDNCCGYESWFPEYNMARMLGPATSDFMTKTDAAGHTYYERTFTNGVVFSNPTQTAVGSVPLPAGTYSGVDCSADAPSCKAETGVKGSLTLSTASASGHYDDGAILLGR